MIRLDEIPHVKEQPQSLAETEALLLKATHELARALGVEPLRVLKALAIVIRRRADFESLKIAPEMAANRTRR
jgi:hypothetical protein